MAKTTEPELEAGRKMDAQVAYYVMDWRWYNPPGFCSAFVSPEAQGTLERIYLASAPTATALGTDNVPPYSEDRAAAQQVIEKAQEWSDARRYGFLMYLRWAIEDRIQQNITEREVILYAEPIDICRAALAALKEDK